MLVVADNSHFFKAFSGNRDKIQLFWLKFLAALASNAILAFLVANFATDHIFTESADECHKNQLIANEALEYV